MPDQAVPEHAADRCVLDRHRIRHFSGIRERPQAWGQDAAVTPGSGEEGTAPEEQPVPEETDGKLEPAQAGPRREPRFLPPRLRPGALTKEEEEEAERLRKLGAKFGTDPTAIVGRVQMTGQYLNLPQGAHARDAILRVDLPFRKNWLLRMDLPYLKWVDPNRSGATERSRIERPERGGGVASIQHSGIRRVPGCAFHVSNFR